MRIGTRLRCGVAVGAAVVAVGFGSMLVSGAGAKVAAHAAAKGCGPKPVPAPFTAKDLANAVNYADCVAKKTILQGEKDLPQLGQGAAKVCDEVEAHPEARPALIKVADTLTKSADTNPPRKNRRSRAHADTDGVTAVAGWA